MREFDIAMDMEEMASWYAAHSNPSPKASSLPAIGFIVPGVAVGFLRRVEGGYGHIDGLISNPSTPSDVRHQAIDAIAHKLLQVAKEEGMEGVLVYSKDESTIVRSEKHGFVKLPHTLLAVDLSNRSV